MPEPRLMRSCDTPAGFPVPGILIPVILLFCATAANAEGLSLIGADNGSIEIALPASSEGRLVFHHTSDEGPEFVLDVGTFLSDGDLAASVTLGDAGAGVTERLAFEAGQHRAIVPFSVEGLIPGIKYSARLTASSADEPQTWTVTIHQPGPQAEIDVDANNLPLPIEIKRLWWPQRDNSFTLSLSEKSGTVPITGLTVRRAGSSVASADFDLKRNLSFKLDDEDVDLTEWPVADESIRNIPAEAKRSLEILVNDLPRGEHKITLQLDAVNAAPGTAPTIEIVAQVRHWWVWPVIVLIVAILVSFFLTKGLVNWRERLRLQAKTSDLRTDWPAGIGAFEQVVWLNATRKQLEMVLDKFSLLPAPKFLLQNLDKATLLFDLLKTYKSLASQLEHLGLPYMLNWRMEMRLDEILEKIEPERLDDTTAVVIRTEFENFEQSLGDPKAIYRQYVAAARRRTNGMLTERRLERIIKKSAADNAQVGTLTYLCNTFIRAEPPGDADTDKLLQIDRTSASFRVLLRFENDDNDEVLKDLVKVIAVNALDDVQIRTMFSIANTAYWEQITAEVATGKPWIRYPTSTEIRALVPTRFEIDLKNERLDDSFMMKNKVVVRWQFELPAEAGADGDENGGARPTRWSRPAKGRSLMQFAPRGGPLKVSATLTFDGEKSVPLTAEVPISSKTDSLTSRLFAYEERVLVAISGVIALASGIVLYYSSKPTFGSLQDYLALFTWGVGVDQGKNLVQTFQDLRKQSGGTTTD